MILGFRNFLLFVLLPYLAVAECEDAEKKLNALFDDPTNETLTEFWSSYDKTCNKKIEKNVRPKITGCYVKTTSAACDLIYDRVVADCATYNYAASNTHCMSFLVAFAQSGETIGRKFIPLVILYAEEVCSVLEPKACPAFLRLCKNGKRYIDSDRKACDSLNGATAFRKELTKLLDKKTDFATLRKNLLNLPGNKAFSRTYITYLWKPAASDTWSSLSCSEDKILEDAVCAALVSLCHNAKIKKSDQFTRICNDVPKPKKSKKKRRSAANSVAKLFKLTVFIFPMLYNI